MHLRYAEHASSDVLLNLSFSERFEFWFHFY